ncbi:ribosome production factor 1-like [Centruroides sculpturatus]|uniref:ribosome production factor 1-like n=1 Tax=Centruroides sculpturatus TaxID=218467 RepID=UPI000C6DA419|nr:ribosome production factor 1-like [Centruroides sculpturatus]
MCFQNEGNAFASLSLKHHSLIKKSRNLFRTYQVKQKLRKKRQKEYQLLSDDAPPKQEPRTIENTREPDETFVDGEDEEIQYDLDTDEMSNYFNRDVVPKILITTAEKPHTKTLLFARELRQTIPNAHLHWRRKFSIKNLIKMAIKKEFTDIIVINEDKRNPNALLVTHLPEGPTAYFRLSGVKFCKNIKRKAEWSSHRPEIILNTHLPEGPTAYFRLSGVKFCKNIKRKAEWSSHRPEIILNNFNTRLGQRVGRMVASLFHYDPQFHGRRVVTFHNQRDYIFVRHHRFAFI